MRINKKYLKHLMDCYESKQKELTETIKSYEKQMEIAEKPILANELKELYLQEANLQGRMSLCKWLIQL